MSFSLNPEKLHHAYLLVGDKSSLESELLIFLKDKLAFSVQANPDFIHERNSVITIEKARELQDFHLRRPFQGARRVFLLNADSITHEAQNALLKLFEEPTVGNHFFLILGDDRSVLPTLRSRMEVYYVSSLKEQDQGRKFIEGSLLERMKTVTTLSEEKDKGGARALIHSLMHEIRHKKNVSQKEHSVLKDLVKADDYLSDRAPSIKILLEHIAHTLPR
jgi:DNA polymerase III delta prime subunit